MIVGLLLTALFVALNGFFVAGEFALVKLRATQIEKLSKVDSDAARATTEICRHLDRYLSATQLGITLASLGLGSLAEPPVAKAITEAFAILPLSISVREKVAHAVALTLLTAVHVLFGELLPKLIAITAAERVALTVARPMQFFYLVSLPGLWLLNGASTLLLKLLGFPSLHAAEGALSEEEILGMLAGAYARGSLSDEKKRLLERVMRFSDAVARQVMVPRTDVISLDIDLSIEQAIARSRAHGFTRYPVVEGHNLDRVMGYINIKDLSSDRPPPNLQAILRDAIVTPEGKPLFELMREMQRGRQHLAIVLDEYGGTSGIATLEDILEEIVGEIHDEYDEEAARVIALSQGSFSVDGLANSNELIEAGISLPDDLEGDTAGGIVLAGLGRLPRPGDVLTVGSWEWQVESVRRRRITRVVVRPRVVSISPAESTST
ncbi:MAG: hemolysin family protein [Deltaproteobacteria bacterium]|nr:hemolysin family protein [Deltaproteobacteria bacterium]